MVKKKIFLVAVVLVLGVSLPAQADLVFESGYNTYDDSDGYNSEVWVTNDAILDVSGGEMTKLEINNYGAANIFEGANIDSLVSAYQAEDTLINIYGGDIDNLIAYNTCEVHLYAYDVTYHPDVYDSGWIEGVYISNNEPFLFSLGLWTYPNLTVIPEPTTFLLFGLGGLLLRRRK